MFENFDTEAQSILSFTIGGVSIGTILMLTIYVIRAIIVNRKQIVAFGNKFTEHVDIYSKKIEEQFEAYGKKVTEQIELHKDDVENAFKEAILPKHIKLDVSGKIVKPINEGLDRMNKLLDAKIGKLDEGILLVLTILNEFTHIQKLTPEMQEKIAEYIDTPAEEVRL